MAEPTIDEMLALLDAAFSHLAGSDLYVDEHYDGTLERTNKAIRAILERYKGLRSSGANGFALLTDDELEQAQLQAIRAFVEKAEARARVGDPNYFCERFTRMIGSRLKDLEEANAGTNDR